MWAPNGNHESSIDSISLIYFDEWYLWDWTDIFLKLIDWKFRYLSYKKMRIKNEQEVASEEEDERIGDENIVKFICCARVKLKILSLI